MGRVPLVAGGLACVVAAGCDPGAASTPPGDVALRIAGAQYVDGPRPEPHGGPEVLAVTLASNFVAPGERDVPIGGTVAAPGTGVLLQLDGDPGYWIVPAGLADVATPGLPSFEATAEYAFATPLGARDLVVQATDASGSAGPERRETLTFRERSIDGALVFALRWDVEADLDLHVVDPAGEEIWKRDPSTYDSPPLGVPDDPEALARAGVLDFDANAACVVDGRRRENVIWAEAPPAGRYRVRVDTFSLCGTPAAHWSVEAVHLGRVVARATGLGTELDERQPHDRGAGALALEVDVP